MAGNEILVASTQTATVREIELVQLIADQKRAKDIAEIRDVSQKTVEAQIMSLKRKFGCKTLPGLVVLFIRNNLIN